MNLAGIQTKKGQEKASITHAAAFTSGLNEAIARNLIAKDGPLQDLKFIFQQPVTLNFGELGTGFYISY